MTNQASFLADPERCLSVIAILVNRLGGSVVIIQDDLEVVRFSSLREEITTEAVMTISTTPSKRIN